MDRAGHHAAGHPQPRRLRKLPVLTKADIRAQLRRAQGRFQPARQPVYKATGGSTGEPMRFGYTRESNDRRIAVMWRGYEWAGSRMGRRTLFCGAARSASPRASTSSRIALQRRVRPPHAQQLPHERSKHRRVRRCDRRYAGSHRRLCRTAGAVVAVADRERPQDLAAAVDHRRGRGAARIPARDHPAGVRRPRSIPTDAANSC
jgi:hypothetical protein